MATHRIVSALDKRTKIEIELPFTETGEEAFDEDGDPIKGRTPVTITLPRFDCLPIEGILQLQDTIKGIEQSDGKTQQETGREVALSMLKPYVSEAVYNLLSERALFELHQISEYWSTQSTLPVGELSASNASSRSTRRLSTTS